MVAVAVVASNTRRQDFEGAVSGTTNIGAGAGVGTFAEAIYQGAQTWGRKIASANAERGFWLAITSIDMTTAANMVVMMKASLVNSAAISTVANGGGVRHRIGSSTTNYNEYIVADQGDQGDNGEFEYGGRIWLLNPIDPSVTAWIDAQPASAPTLTAITDVSITGAVTIVTKNENIIWDAVDFNAGLWMTGGTGADPDGTLQDFIDDDEGDITNGRFGNVFTQEGVIFVYGALTAGREATPTSTETRLTDGLQTVVWPGGKVDAGWNGVFWDLATTGTTITFSNMSWVGRGRDNQQRGFDANDSVADGTEIITILGHGFATGDAVLYNDQNGTAVTGLTDLTEYFVENLTVDTFHLHTTRQAALTLATPINLTGSSSHQHTLHRQPDTRPVFDITGTSGTFSDTGSVYQRFASIDMNSAVTFTGCTFVECGLMTVNGGTLSGCTVVAPLVNRGNTGAALEGAVTCDDLDDITSTSFENGEWGHAVIRTGTAGADAWNANTLTKYWTHGGDPGKGAEFLTSAAGIDEATDVITTLNTHGFITGDRVFYNDNGGSSITLSDGTGYWVNVISTTQVSFHVSEARAISDTGRQVVTVNGAETHTLYSENAAIVNNTGGAMTINVTNGGSTPYVRNYGNVATTSVVNSVTVTVTVLDTAGSPVQDASVYVQTDTGPFNDDDEIIRKLTNASGVATESFAYVSDTDVVIRVRKKGFQVFSGTGIIKSPEGLSVSVRFLADPNVE